MSSLFQFEILCFFYLAPGDSPMPEIRVKTVLKNSMVFADKIRALNF